VKFDVSNALTTEIPSDVTVKVLGGFENTILDMLEQKPFMISIECAHLEHVTSSHINALWLAYLYCKEAGVEICIASPSEGLVRILKILDLHDLFMFDYDTVRTRMRKAVRSISSEYSSTFADEFMATVDDINLALDRFKQYVDTLKNPQILDFELKTIFYEVATNIRQHAGLKENELIVFTARVLDKKLTMVFADSGKPFDLSKKISSFVPEKAAKNRQRRGFGIEMVHRLIESISYRRLDNAINVLTVEKDLP